MKKYLFMPLVFLICGIFCASAQTEPVRFAFMTDLHWSASLTSSQAALRACVNDINSRNDIDFVVVGGDLTDFGSDSEIADVKAVLDGLRPQLVAPVEIVAVSRRLAVRCQRIRTDLCLFGTLRPGLRIGRPVAPHVRTEMLQCRPIETRASFCRNTRPRAPRQKSTGGQCGSP